MRWKGLLKMEENVAINKPNIICMICFTNEDTSLSRSLVSCHDMTMKTTNLRRHLMEGERHEKDRPLICKTIKEFEDKMKALTLSKSSLKKSSVSLSTASTSFFSPKANAKEVRAEGEHLMFVFLQKASVAMRNSNCIELQRYVQHCVRNHKMYGPGALPVTLSRYSFEKERVRAFSNFIDFVKSMVETMRNYYVNLCSSSKPIPFLNVAHDDWNSTEHDVIGVSLHFINPMGWKKFSLAIGLTRHQSKASKEQAKEVIKILDR